jgi:hypothetical protein
MAAIVSSYMVRVYQAFRFRIAGWGTPPRSDT